MAVVESNPDLTHIFSTRMIPKADIEWIKSSEYYPINQIDEHTPFIEWFIPASHVEYLLLGEIKLVIEGCVVAKMTGAALAAEEEKKFVVTPLGIYGLFSNYTISLNGIVIEDANNMLIWQNHVELATATSSIKYSNRYRMAGVYWDKPGDQDKITAGATDLELAARQTLYKESKPVTLVGNPLLTGILTSEGILPTNVSLRIRLTKANQNQILLAATADIEKYRYKINKCKLIVPKYRLNDRAALKIEKLMEKHPATYTSKRYLSTYVTLPKSIRSTTQEGIYSGLSPLGTILTMIEPGRFAGDMTKSCVKYDSFNLRSVKINLEEESEMRDPIKITEHDQSEAVLALSQGLGFYDDPDRTCKINVDNFSKGLQLFLFNHCNYIQMREDEMQLLKHGNLKYEIIFKDSSNEAIVCIFHMIAMKTVQITFERRILHQP
jgi:hypothetical protein